MERKVLSIELKLQAERGPNTVLSWSELYKPLILCVDDDEEILDLIRVALESKGYRVLTSSDGFTALQAFAVCPIDAVILDHEMPGMDGVELAREMMRIKPKIPKLLFSGTPSLPHEESKAFQGYCAKPNGLSALPTQISAMTSLARTA